MTGRDAEGNVHRRFDAGLVFRNFPEVSEKSRCPDEKVRLELTIITYISVSARLSSRFSRGIQQSAEVHAGTPP